MYNYPSEIHLADDRETTSSASCLHHHLANIRNNKNMEPYSPLLPIPILEANKSLPASQMMTHQYYCLEAISPPTKHNQNTRLESARVKSYFADAAFPESTADQFPK
jgi:7-keto-8-aminopelargonate synthetase-like enzyme